MVKQKRTRKIGGSNKNTMKNNHDEGEPITIGLIFAKWCGHCQSLKPEWEKMKEKLDGKHKIIEIDDDDADKNEIIDNINKSLHQDKLEANGFPTIFKTHRRRLEYYDGGRTANDIEKWALTGISKQKGAAINNNTKRDVPVKSWANYIFGGFYSGTVTPNKIKSKRKSIRTTSKSQQESPQETSPESQSESPNEKNNKNKSEKN